MTANTSSSVRSKIGSQSNHSRPARELRPVAFPGNALGPIGALVAAQSHGADDHFSKAWVTLEEAPQLALDGSPLMARGTPALVDSRPFAPLLDPVEQGLAGGDRCQDERHASRNGALDVADDLGPFYVAERRVDDEKLFTGDDAREQDRYRLAVLSARVRQWHERPAIDQLPALGGDGDVGRAAARRGATRASSPSAVFLGEVRGHDGDPRVALHATCRRAGIASLGHSRFASPARATASRRGPAGRGEIALSAARAGSTDGSGSGC